METFHKDISDWLIPLGYTEVFNNHPSSKEREFHFSKEGIRVVCVNGVENYCYLHADILKLPYNLSIKTGKFYIGFSELDEVHKYVSAHAARIIPLFGLEYSL
jgi:hypothetical protein